MVLWWTGALSSGYQGRGNTHRWGQGCGIVAEASIELSPFHDLENDLREPDSWGIDVPEGDIIAAPKYDIGMSTSWL